MHKRWLIRPDPDHQAVASMATAIGVNPHIASLLVQKNITNFDQAKAYFRPDLTQLHDPWTMQDMDKAVDRLLDALAKKEPILVYGDYDVDGVTSVAMFYGMLQTMHPNIDFYIPDRYTEGYGVSKQAIAWAIEAGFKLIVTLDCGIKALDCIAQAQAAGIDVIVCDHHEPGECLPPAYAVLDPKRSDCLYPFKALSGCGVGFKLLQALCIRTNLPMDPLYGYLDLVAISIACDLVPMHGENRILTYHGLQQLNQQPRPGIQAMVQAANLQFPLSCTQLAFVLGPRLNAAGRVQHGSSAVRLLLADDLAAAHPLAQDLEQQNGLRQALDKRITQEAIDMIQADAQLMQAKSTVLFKPDWHKGVIGIVASRCIEHYYKPTIILTASGNKATGSARSVPGFNVYDAIAACEDLLDQYGGHAHAAGLSLPIDNVAAFQKRFEAVVTQQIHADQLIPTQLIDLLLALKTIDHKFYRILKQMAPFGNDNTKATFASYGVMAKSYRILKEKHLKLYITDHLNSNLMIEAIGFGLAYHEPIIRDQKPFHIAYTLDENHYQGNQTLQLMVKDIQPA